MQHHVRQGCRDRVILEAIPHDLWRESFDESCMARDLRGGKVDSYPGILDHWLKSSLAKPPFRFDVVLFIVSVHPYGAVGKAFEGEVAGGDGASDGCGDGINDAGAEAEMAIEGCGVQGGDGDCEKGGLGGGYSVSTGNRVDGPAAALTIFVRQRPRCQSLAVFSFVDDGCREMSSAEKVLAWEFDLVRVNDLRRRGALM